MADEQETQQPLTDEQLAAAFPGQDLDHVKSMMGKMDGEGTDVSPSADEPDTKAEEYPDWIPEKFRTGTVEEATQKLAESYKSLESKLGKPDATSEESSTSEEGEGEGDDSEAKLMSMRDVEQEFLDKGSISQATYDQFEAKGVSKDVIDAYIAGQQAIANQRVTKVYDAVGGEKEYGEMLQWAGENWTDAEVQAFDGIMKGTDDAAIMVAVRGLKADFAAANPKDPSLLNGDSGDVKTGSTFESKAEMTAAMKDPRYKTDPAYRRSVEEKVGRSDIW